MDASSRLKALKQRAKALNKRRSSLDSGVVIEPNEETTATAVLEVNETATGSTSPASPGRWLLSASPASPSGATGKPRRRKPRSMELATGCAPPTAPMAQRLTAFLRCGPHSRNSWILNDDTVFVPCVCALQERCEA